MRVVPYKEYLIFIRTLFNIDVKFYDENNKKIEDILADNVVVAKTIYDNNKYKYFLR